MSSRLDLHEELCDVLGSRQVYFQPPESVKMKYPCIVYAKDDEKILHADDYRYIQSIRYVITVIDTNPDTEIPQNIMMHFTKCSYDRHYTANNLNHEVMTLYY